MTTYDDYPINERPDAFLALRDELEGLFTLVKRVSKISDRISFDVSSISPTDIDSAQGAAGWALRRIQALYHYSEPGNEVLSHFCIMHIEGLQPILRDLYQALALSADDRSDLDRYETLLEQTLTALYLCGASGGHSAQIVRFS